MSIIHGITAVIMAIVNGVVAVFSMIVSCLTCGKAGGRRKATTGTHTSRV
jgi:hypothetical protein